MCASIETAPDELHDTADEVLALMPWGRLLHGIVCGDADICAGLRRVARDGGRLDVTVGTSIWREPVPLEIRNLPELTPDYVDSVLTERLARHGWRLTVVQWLPGGVRSSSWARRLGSSTPDVFARLRAEAH